MTHMHQVQAQCDMYVLFNMFLFKKTCKCVQNSSLGNLIMLQSLQRQREREADKSEKYKASVLIRLPELSE